MVTNQIYIALLIVVLTIIAVSFFLFSKGNRFKSLTPLAGIAFALVIAGIIFGENQWIGYGLIGTGVVLAIIDIIIKTNR